MVSVGYYRLCLPVLLLDNLLSAARRSIACASDMDEIAGGLTGGRVEAFKNLVSYFRKVICSHLVTGPAGIFYHIVNPHLVPVEMEEIFQLMASESNLIRSTTISIEKFS